MSIVRYNTNEFVPTPFSTLIDRFFNESVSHNGGRAFIPKVDVLETEAAYEVHVAVPGLSKEDFKIELNDRQLTISGERKFETEKKEKNYRAVETQFGSFRRSFALPENVDAGRINAKYNNGILELTIPKDEKKALKQVIKVD